MSRRSDTDTQSLKRRNKRADHGRILEKETDQTWRRSSSATALLVLLLGTSIVLSILPSILPWWIHPWIYKLSFANNYDLFLCSHLEDIWHRPPPSSDAVPVSSLCECSFTSLHFWLPLVVWGSVCLKFHLDKKKLTLYSMIFLSYSLSLF